MTVWKYGENINTDMLFPGKYTYTCSTAEEIKPHLLEDLDPLFAKNVKEGDLIFAGRNFGCGSSREQPVLGLKAVGIAAVVAGSFARIFYRNGFNQGLPLLESSEASREIQDGDLVQVDLKTGEIFDLRQQKKYFAKPIPPFMQQLIASGGLMKHLAGERS